MYNINNVEYDVLDEIYIVNQDIWDESTIEYNIDK